MNGGGFSDVTASSSTTFTNKSIDSDNNTITNIVNADKINSFISRALVSDSNGDVSASAVTDTEVGYLDGEFQRTNTN